MMWRFLPQTQNQWDYVVNTHRVKIAIDDKIIEQVTNFIYLGNGKDINTKLQKYNKLNGVIKRHFGKQM
jgi:outer membrane protein assembly factor BamE (lipoprotein component of BamABCDE complex)